MLVDLPLGIAEIDGDGTAIITKHQHVNGIVTEEVVTCQFLYELQGAICLYCTLSEPLSDENLRSKTPQVMPRQTPRTFASKASAKIGGQAIQSHNSTWLTETRVKVSGIKRHPPPPTTKLTICYRAGYQSRILVNATDYGVGEEINSS
jgi:hypothetical protein